MTANYPSIFISTVIFIILVACNKSGSDISQPDPHSMDNNLYLQFYPNAAARYINPPVLESSMFKSLEASRQPANHDASTIFINTTEGIEAISFFKNLSKTNQFQQIKYSQGPTEATGSQFSSANNFIYPSTTLDKLVAFTYENNSTGYWDFIYNSGHLFSMVINHYNREPVSAVNRDYSGKYNQKKFNYKYHKVGYPTQVYIIYN